MLTGAMAVVARSRSWRAVARVPAVSSSASVLSVRCSVRAHAQGSSVQSEPILCEILDSLAA